MHPFDQYLEQGDPQGLHQQPFRANNNMEVVQRWFKAVQGMLFKTLYKGEAEIIGPAADARDQPFIDMFISGTLLEAEVVNNYQFIGFSNNIMHVGRLQTAFTTIKFSGKTVESTQHPSTSGSENQEAETSYESKSLPLLTIPIPSIFASDSLQIGKKLELFLQRYPFEIDVSKSRFILFIVEETIKELFPNRLDKISIGNLDIREKGDHWRCECHPENGVASGSPNKRFYFIIRLSNVLEHAKVPTVPQFYTFKLTGESNFLSAPGAHQHSLDKAISIAAWFLFRDFHMSIIESLPRDKAKMRQIFASTTSPFLKRRNTSFFRSGLLYTHSRSGETARSWSLITPSIAVNEGFPELHQTPPKILLRSSSDNAFHFRVGVIIQNTMSRTGSILEAWKAGANEADNINSVIDGGQEFFPQQCQCSSDETTRMIHCCNGCTNVHCCIAMRIDESRLPVCQTCASDSIAEAREQRPKKIIRLTGNFLSISGRP